MTFTILPLRIFTLAILLFSASIIARAQYPGAIEETTQRNANMAGAEQQRQQQADAQRRARTQPLAPFEYKGLRGRAAEKQLKRDEKLVKQYRKNRKEEVKAIAADVKKGVYHPDDAYRIQPNGDVVDIRDGRVVNPKQISGSKVKWVADINHMVRKNAAKNREMGKTPR